MSKDFMCWTEKYKPKTKYDIIGNKQQIYDIIDWLNNYNTNKKKRLLVPHKRKKNNNVLIDSDEIESDNNSSLITKNLCKKQRSDDQCSSMIIIGDHGVGKSSTISTILSDLKYNVKLFNFNTLGSNKDIDAMIESLIKSINIFDKILGNGCKKPVLIIDNLESVSSQVEKNFILSLFKYNDDNWDFPIIFVSDGKHSKITSILKTNTKIIYFKQPSTDSLKKLLGIVAVKEDIKFVDEEAVDFLLNNIQKDFRRLLLVLQDLKSNYTDSLSVEDIENYINISKKKDLNLDIFSSTSELITNYKNISDCLRLYESEKVIIPLMMQQNYIKILNDNKQNKSIYNTTERIAKVISKGDLIENYIYSDQNWDMPQVHGILTCAIPSYILTTSNSFTNIEWLKRKLDFPDDLNRTSIRRINKRNIVNSNNCIKNMNIEDFIKANKLIRNLIYDDKIQDCVNIFEGYSAEIKNIESILKIDKTDDQTTDEPKKILSGLIKKKITYMLDKINNKV